MAGGRTEGRSVFRTNKRIVGELGEAGGGGQRVPGNRSQGQEDQYPSSHIMGQGWPTRDTRDCQGAVLWERCHQ